MYRERESVRERECEREREREREGDRERERREYSKVLNCSAKYINAIILHTAKRIAIQQPDTAYSRTQNSTMQYSTVQCSIIQFS
jgi:hypothetical protein